MVGCDMIALPPCLLLTPPFLPACLPTQQNMFHTGISAPGERPRGVALVDGYNLLFKVSGKDAGGWMGGCLIIALAQWVGGWVGGWIQPALQSGRMCCGWGGVWGECVAILYAAGPPAVEAYRSGSGATRA